MIQPLSAHPIYHRVDGKTKGVGIGRKVLEVKRGSDW